MTNLKKKKKLKHFFFHHSCTMDITKYLDEMRNIEEYFQVFLDEEENIEKNLNNLNIKFEDMKIRNNKHDLRLLLHFISSLCDNYYRSPTFYIKIERILQIFKDEIKKFYLNSEIFNIFKQNKRILLFLINEQLLTVDEYVFKKIITSEYIEKKYPQYFAPEIKRIENEKWFPKDELAEDLEKGQPDNFNELRNKGENERFICKLIRDDLVEDFITHVNKNSISVNAEINPSIYETNSFLLERQNSSEQGITLIEYAAFFGSIQIFTFLKNENARLTPSLWLYVIHSNNAELIHLLEELHIEKSTTAEEKEKLYIECFKESIKCHHNSIANYFINNYLQSKDANSEETFIQSLEYYNFSFLQNERVNKSSFCHLCHFDYYTIAKDFSTMRDINVNSIVIQNQNIQ